MAVGSTRPKSDSLRLLDNVAPFPEPVAKPFFIAVCGLPGTDKSFMCRRLQETLPSVLVGNDIMRKMLFTQPYHSVEESRYLFRCIYVVEKPLSKSIPVVLDTTIDTSQEISLVIDKVVHEVLHKIN